MDKKRKSNIDTKIKTSILKYKKIIMLALVLIAVVICICATYITEYNLNKVSREEVLTTEVTSQYKSSEEFLKNFAKFQLYLSQDVKPYTDEDKIVYGKKVFTTLMVANEDAEVKGTVKLTIGLGANWIKYISKTENKAVTLGKATDITIEGIDLIFPTEGKLWFVKVEQPTLYVLAEWSDYSGTKYHTYLEYDYNTYSVKPDIVTE